MRTTAELREEFLSYFESKGHLRQPRGSLVPPPEDVSTLVTVAGMQPLKPYFLGVREPPAPRLTTVQPVFRVVDIEEVGLSPSHITLFEMLGNFSIGDYFKRGAVELAWEFVVDHLKLDPDRVWVSVYEGNPVRRLDIDEEAIEAWEAIGFPRERIVPMGEDNFWQLGPPGPCGPCSELYYDRGEKWGCLEPDCGLECPRCKRYLEFWNLVFMQYDQTADGVLTPLPKQNVDTGLGLARAAVIEQDVESIFDTDGYQAIMAWIAERSGTRYGESETATKSHRVLADHAHGMAFLANDGVVPGNEGREYILRRIIRRAIQYAGRIGLEAPFLAELSDVVAGQLREHYPELTEHREHIQRVLEAEEERFSQTLARGMRLFEEAAADGDLTGDEAFRLHDTYGFPLELTRELAAERGLAVDEEGFTRLMGEQRERSRAASSGRAEQRVVEFARTAGFATEFVGFEKTEALTQIGALHQLEGGLFLAKLRESPFYAEGGGQVTDRGFVEHDGTGARATLREAYRLGDDQVLLFEGEGFAEGDRVRAVVAWSARYPTMANHTATHLLHAALREALGEHVRQAGSAVRPDKLRFDFTHGQPLTPEERRRIEERVNERIWENLPVHAFVTPLEEARQLGAMMLFGEKYGDYVRVVEIPGFSRELCGGTHVRWTAEIGPFVITSEASVGAGTRRIEAVTAGEAFALLHERAREAGELRAELDRVRRESKTKEREPAAAAMSVSGEREREVGSFRVFVAQVENADADQLLAVSDREKQRRSPAAVVLGAAEDGTVHLVANFDPDVAERVSASDVIKRAAAVVGGGGGGRPTMARAGGKQPERLPEALETAERLIVEALT